MRPVLRNAVTSLKPTIIPRSVARNCLLWYDAFKANKSNTSTWQDISGKNRHISMYNFAGVGWTTTSLDFDGVNKYIQLSDTLNSGNNSLSFMVVFSVPNVVGEKNIVLGTQGTSARSFGLFLNNDVLTFACMDSTYGTWWTNAVMPIEANRWYYAVITSDKISLNSCVYLDTEKVMEHNDLDNGLREVNRFKCGINTNNTTYSAMSLRAAAAFDKALTKADVDEIYNLNKVRWGLVTAPVIPSSVQANCMSWWDGSFKDGAYANMTNRLTNNDFTNADNWVAARATMVVANNIASLTGSGESDYTYLRHDYTFVATNKYSVSIQAKVSSACKRLRLYAYPDIILQEISSPQADTWLTLSGSYVASATPETAIRVYAYYDTAAAAANQVAQYKKAKLVDFTLDIGAGNEPTPLEMTSIMAAAPVHWGNTGSVLLNPAHKYYWQDYSGNNRHLKLNNFAYEPGSGWDGDSLVFEGINDYAIRQDAWSAANQSFSTMAVFSVPNVAGNKFINIASQGTSLTFLLYVNNAALTAWLYDSDSGSVTAKKDISANTTYHVIATYDQSDKKTRLYINGALTATSDAVTNGMRQITQIKTGINSNNTQYSAASVRALAAFSRALSGAEVASIYLNNKKRWGL
jgi:hypothetical protein